MATIATTHSVASREEWLKTRLELLEAEKALTRAGDELAKRRQALPWVRVEKDYRFDTDQGEASLKDLFRGRSQLLVYHFMFGPDFESGCPSCSAIADGFNGFWEHLAAHDAMLWAVSRAPLEKLQAYKKRLGWIFPGHPRTPMASTPTSPSMRLRSNNSPAITSIISAPARRSRNLRPARARTVPEGARP